MMVEGFDEVTLGIKEHIKTGMTEAEPADIVERLIYNICRFISSVDDLFDILQTILDNSVIMDGERDGFVR